MLEIPPAGEAADAERAEQISYDVIDRVTQRAEELRRNWAKASGASARASSRASAAATV